MITEAEIQSVDYNANSCIVRMPFFETANTLQNVTAPAYFSVSPGNYNGYAAGDLVWVAFENDRPGNPIVIGKIMNESAKNGGAIDCKNLTAHDSAKLPINTSINTSDSDFNSLIKLINAIKSMRIACGLDADENGDINANEAVCASYVLLLKANVSGGQQVSLAIKTNRSYSSIEEFLEKAYKHYNSYDRFIPIFGVSSGNYFGVFVKNDPDTAKKTLCLTVGIEVGVVELQDTTIVNCYSTKHI